MPMPPVDIETREQGRVWLLPPYSYSVRHIADKLKVGLGTVNKWRKELKEEGLLLLPPDSLGGNEQYSAEQIFSFVIETAAMSEHELSAYCREKGLYVEQVKKWRAISIKAHQKNNESKHQQDSQCRADRKRIKELERELARKDKALAETAALLVLREKFNALWEQREED